MKKASQDRPATQTAAKVQQNSRFIGIGLKKISAPVIVFALGSLTPQPRKSRYQKPQAVRELEEIADIANAKAHPNMPEKYLAKAKYRDDTANGCTRCIVDYIRFMGGQAERINTTGIPIDKRRQVTDVLGNTRSIGSIEWRKGGGTIGSADISATIRGRSVKIEVKVGKDRMSAAQRQYKASIEAAGGIYYIAKDFTGFVEWYKAIF